MIASAISSQSGSPTSEDERADDEVEAALHRPVRAGEDRRPQLEERRALARHVLAALDEELRRVGREPHLHPLPVRLLDHLEHGALVEVGLGEDQLVGPHLLEHEPRARRASRAAAKPGTAVRRDDAHELVVDAAAAAASELP